MKKIHYNINKPPFEQVSTYSYEMYRKDFAKMGFNIDDFKAKAIECSDNSAEYNKFTEDFIVENIKEITDFYKGSNSSQEHLTNFISYLDAIYTFINCKNFLLQIPKPDKEENIMSYIPDFTDKYSFENFADKIDDMILGFSYSDGTKSPLYIRLCKSNGIFQKIGDEEKTDCFTMGYFKGVDTSYGVSQEILGQIYIIKNKFPKFIFSAPNILIGTGCHNYCGKCPLVEYNSYYPSREGQIFTESLCKISKRKLEIEHCYLNRLDPYKILSVFCYIWEMYENRNSLPRKNSKHKKNYTHNISVHTPIPNKDNEYSIVNLNNFSAYKRKYKPWQGGHHNSPVEHERRGHIRVLKNADGSVRKVVEVKPSVINKGKTKIIYNVKK